MKTLKFLMACLKNVSGSRGIAWGYVMIILSFALVFLIIGVVIPQMY